MLLKKILIFCLLLILSLHYLYNVFEELVPKNMHTYINVFDKEKVIINLSNELMTLSPQYISFLEFIYKQDSEIIIAMAHTHFKHGNLEEAVRLYKAAVSLDPKNEDYNERLVEVLFVIDNQKEFKEWLYQYAREFLPYQFQSYVAEIDFEPIPLSFYKMEIVNLFNDAESHEVRFAKLFYRIGLNEFKNNSYLTEQLWNLSSLLEPDLSYYYVELAGLYTSIQANTSKANESINRCLTNSIANKHCLEIKESGILPPGSFSDGIMNR